MNISFFDGVNDGKFYSINAGKYDELGEEDIDISEGVNEEIEDDDADTCLNRFAALEKDASKLHMDLNNLRNEFKGSCKDWNDLSDTVDHMLNNIAELRTIMNRADDRLNKRLNVISEANVVLTDKLNLVEKKLEVFKCIDILDRVTKLEEQYETGIITFNELRDKLKKLDIDVTSNMENNMDKVNDRMGIIEKKFAMFYDILDRVTKLEEQIKPTVLEEAKELEVNPSVLDRIRTLEEDNISTQLKVANVASKDTRDDVRLHSIDLKLKKLEEKVETLEGKHLTTSNSNKLAIGRLYERLGKVEPKLEKLERDLTSNGMLIADLGRDIVNTDCELNNLSDRVSKLDSKFAVMDKIIDAINGTISGCGHDYVIIADRINELESKLKKLEDTKCDKSSPSVVDDILDRLGKLEEDSVSVQQNIASVVTKDIRDDARLHSIDNKLKELKRKINEELDWKDLTDTAAFESGKNDIQSDAVNHPKHYTDGKYECIDFIEEYGMLTHIGNAIKYVTRAGIKDKKKYAEDLNKAFWYLHRYNTPQSMGHIDVVDYCHEKKLPIELADVIIAISQEDYKRAEKKLGNYIVKLTGKTPKALEDEQSK